MRGVPPPWYLLRRSVTAGISRQSGHLVLVAVTGGRVAEVTACGRERGSDPGAALPPGGLPPVGWRLAAAPKRRAAPAYPLRCWQSSPCASSRYHGNFASPRHSDGRASFRPGHAAGVALEPVTKVSRNGSGLERDRAEIPGGA